MESNQFKRVAIYVRNSTNEDKQNPQTQINPLIEKCKRENWQYEIFQEFASGDKQSRPELDKMMAQIRNKEYDALLVWRLDRLGRSLKHLLQLIEELKINNVKFLSLPRVLILQLPKVSFSFLLLVHLLNLKESLFKKELMLV